MFQQLLKHFLQKFVKNMGRQPQTPGEWMRIQDEAVRYLNKTKGVPQEAKPSWHTGWKPKVIEGGHPSDLERASERTGKVFDPKTDTYVTPKGPKKEPKTVEDFRDKGDWDPGGMAQGGIAPLVGEPSYAANFYDDRTPMEEGGPTPEKFKTDKMYNEMMKWMHEYEQYKKHYKWEKKKRSGIEEAAQGGRIGMAGGGGIIKLLKKFLKKKPKKDVIKPFEFPEVGIGSDFQKKLLDDMLKSKSRLKDFDPKGKPHAEGGRIGMKVGKIAQGIKTLLKKKKPKIKKDRVATADEIEDYIEILDPTGEAGIVEEGMTVGHLDNLVTEHKAYADDMYRQYKRGDLDKYVKPEVLEEQTLRFQKSMDDGIDEAYEEIAGGSGFSGDYKYDADVLTDSMEEVWKKNRGPSAEFTDKQRGVAYNMALKRMTGDLKRKMDFKKGLKDVEQKIELQMFDPKDRLPNASGGPVDHDALVQMYLAEGLSYADAVQAAQSATNLPWDTLKKAEGGRAEFIYGGSAGLRALLKRLRGKNKRIFPPPPQRITKLIDKGDRDYIDNLKLQQLETILKAAKIDKDMIAQVAKNKKMADPGLDFLMGKMDEIGLMPKNISKYTDVDKDIMDIEMMIKNYTEKKLKRRPNYLGGRIGYAGGGQAGLPAVTLGLPHGSAMQQPQMPAGPQPAGIPGGTIVAQNQMQQSPWMGSQMQQGIGGQRPPMGGMPRPMAAEGGRIGFGLGGINKGRRAFMKWLAGILGTGVAAGTGLLKLGKAAKVAPKVTEAAEVITRGADGMPSYIYDLIEVVKAKGTRDVIEGFKKSDYSTVHSYKGVDVIEEAGGTTRIKKSTEGVAEDASTGKMQEGTSKEIEMEIRPQHDEMIDTDSGVSWYKDADGKKVYEQKIPNEYAEGTVRPDMDGKMKDFEEFIDDADHLELQKIADEGSFLTQKRNRTGKASGGLAYALGE